ncbi:dual specificity protein kinase CLK1-like isoform X2 [Poecilia latipinna]|uniref:dual specificity protein kinase CLK1-like isoform X2 n=1 Tax=Poecilia latipinna TaxID=48699 RepID=UPI00072E9272|nr:PREDICTED: dual specificity protein kinase CLK1-like isoform X2 [Poecilia latipinna]
MKENVSNRQTRRDEADWRKSPEATSAIIEVLTEKGTKWDKVLGVNSRAMGKNDDNDSWRGMRKFKSDSKSGSFKKTQQPILDVSKWQSKDTSVQLESASFHNSSPIAADDGPKETQQRETRQNDDDGNLDYHIGLVLEDRYEISSTLGEGAFGKVVECIDRYRGQRVAVKIVKKFESFCKVARSEITVLEEINSLDDDNRFPCVRMLDWFKHKSHICIVLERLGPSTFNFLQQNDFVPFSVEQIRHIAFQIFRAVSFLHRNKLTHTDLKPENILFVSCDCDRECSQQTKCKHTKPRTLDIKVVDFGTATFDHQHHETLVSTRHYRAPEVILDLGWNQSCDVWSLGCVLIEYYLGRTLFPSHDCGEHLAMMEKVLGPIPPRLLKQTRKKKFVKNERLSWNGSSSSEDDIEKHCQPLTQYMRTNNEEEKQLFDLLSCMLEYDVSRRITLEEALWHPFFCPLRTQHEPQQQPEQQPEQS